MSNQPEALRLADELDAYHTASHHKEAAAELRRLHAVEDEWIALSQDQGKLEGQIDRLVAELRRLSDENEELKQRVKTRAQALRQWLEKTEWIQETGHADELGMHRADAIRKRLQKIEAQRDALLELLDRAADTLHECGLRDEIYAAIAAAEGEGK